jgi:nucleoside phosphorylase
MPPDTGEVSAADITRQIVTEWNPAWVVLVGVAGGFMDRGVGLGDVVVASKIYAYDVGKIHTANSERRGAFERRDRLDVDVDRSWFAHAKVLADPAASKLGDWTQRIRVSRRPDRKQRRLSRLHIGAIASGDKVVDNPDYQFFAEAKSTLPELYAIEMEGSGVGVSIRNLQAERQIGFLMIRGISDLPRQGDEHDQSQGRAERDSWKPYAAAAAAAFLEHLLSQPGAPGARSAQPAGDGVVPDSSPLNGASLHSPSFPVALSAPQFDDLVGGLESLPGAVLTKVEGFLAQYLGLPDSPVPFGGRTDEIRALDRWLADPSKPYALLVAPTGRGKSALVSRWAQAVATDARVKVAFLPVSERFGTARPENAYAILGARLRRIVSAADGASYPDAGFWLTEIDAYFRNGCPEGRPLLVVIDGADEAEGWSLGRDLAIPPVRAPGLKVLVTARPLPDDVEDSWRTRLNWNQHDVQWIELPALGRAAVRQLVLGEGTPIADSAETERFASEVYRLSAGDPILVQLYIQLCIDRAQSGRALAVHELQTIEPGLAGYFRREWESLTRQWNDDDPLQEPLAHALLFILSCARGPLSKEDLVALTKDEGGTGVLVNQALASLKRLVIGNASSGYVFGHPRFGQFFREEFFGAEEIHDWETRITDYGRGIIARLNAGELAPAAVPTYVLQHHANHLIGTRADSSEVFAVITRPWLLAWEAYAGTHDGFLQDLHRAWTIAEERGTAAIAQVPPRLIEFNDTLKMQIRAALLASSIRGLAGSIPFDVLRQLVEVGRWTPLQGIAYAGAMPSDPQRKAALCALADLGHVLPNQPTFEAIRGIRDTRTRVEALACVLPRLDADWADSATIEALALVAEIGDLGDRAAALLALVPMLPDVALDQARSLGASARNEYDRVRILAALAARRRGVAKVRLVNDALAETTRCVGGLRVLALQSLASVLTASTLPQALALAEGIEAPLDRAQAFLVLLPRVPRKTRKELIAMIELAMNDIAADDRIELLIALLEWLDIAEYPRILERISADAEVAGQPGARNQAISIIARWLAINGQTDQALDLVGSTPALSVSALAKAEVLVDLVDAVPAPDLGRLIEACLGAIAATESPEREAIFYADLAARVSEPFQEPLAMSAIAAAQRVRQGQDQARYLALVANVLPVDKRTTVLDEALRSAREVGDAWHLASATALSQLLKFANSTERQVILDRTMRILQRINGFIERAYTISLLLPYVLAGDLRSRLAGEALDALGDMVIGVSVTASGNRIPNRFMLESLERQRTDIMLALVPLLDDGLLHKALHLARSSTYPAFAAEMLVAIGKRLELEDRRAVLDEALGLVPQETEASRGHVYGILFSAVDANEQEAIVNAISKLADPHDRALGFASFVEHAPEERQPVFESLARQAFAGVERPQDQYWGLLYLASLVPEDRRDVIYQEAAGAAALIPGHWERMMRVSDVAVHLSGEDRAMCVASAIEAARLLRPINGRWRALSMLTCRLMELGMADLAVALALEIEDETEKARANVCLRVRLDPKFDVDEALSTGLAISNPNLRAELLLTIAEHAPASCRSHCLEQALSAALVIPRDHDRQFILEILMQQVEQLADIDRYVLWSRVLRELGMGDRRRLLHDLMIVRSMFEYGRTGTVLMAMAEAIAETDDLFSENQ